MTFAMSMMSGRNGLEERRAHGLNAAFEVTAAPNFQPVAALPEFRRLLKSNNGMDSTDASTVSLKLLTLGFRKTLGGSASQIG